ncbi:uncharacterized protein LOC132384701 isoform X2 [Hypanus sabinus]|uniref:uncharacterized protein LOC132384701 isoform X2 n=1 Tax=Hypanus sabinus TaxID=79690 RepID=UPI0028C4104A|nr:uncharacterized protein LOC132384701 isoform X2 [Hypanus sabinus]
MPALRTAFGTPTPDFSSGFTPEAFPIIFSILFRHLNSSCSITEYEFKDICCPKCEPGSYVEEHCTEYGGTICHSCNTGTYQDSLNADEDCLKCTICGEGTYEILACSSTRDTVCDCTEGFYCTNITRDGCRECLKHRHCPPGQQVIRRAPIRIFYLCSSLALSTMIPGTATQTQRPLRRRHHEPRGPSEGGDSNREAPPRRVTTCSPPRTYRRNTECGPCANGNCFSEGSSEKVTKLTETRSITANATNVEYNQTTVITLSVIVVFLILLCIFFSWKQILKYFGLTMGCWLKGKPGNIGNPNPILQESVEEQGQHTKNINCATFSVEESTYFITPDSDLKDDQLCGRGKSTKYLELKLDQHEMKLEVHTISAIKSSGSVEPFWNDI